VGSLAQASYTAITGVGTLVSSADTCGAANEVTPSCSSSSVASDLTYLWTSDRSGRFVFSATGSRFTPVLVVRDASLNPLACSTTGQITRSASLGSKLYVTVDGANADCGTFSLSVTCATCGTCPAGYICSCGQCIDICTPQLRSTNRCPATGISSGAVP
jgi:hypothetical protein